MFGRILQDSRQHRTSLARKIEAALETSPHSLASATFNSDALNTCMKHRPQMGLQEAVARSLLPDASIYLIVGFDTAGRTTFLYIGNSVCMSIRTVAHALHYERETTGGPQLYRMARQATSVYHLPLLRIEDEESTAEVLAVMEHLWSIALGTCQRNGNLMEARRAANLTNVEDTVVGANSEHLASCFLPSHLRLY